ncbi:MAG: serine hydrolase domain-containing protein, partial [Acidobacteriota bacterium]
PAGIDSMVERARSSLGTPGISVALVLDDELAWSAGYGLADVENEVPARADTVYRIASISKPMASTAIMQLVEAGRVDLEDPVRQHVPFFPHKPLMITLRQIMTHTSGIRHYKPGEFDIKEHFDSLESAVRIFKDDPLLFTPGTQYGYSSYAYNLLAAVVETASGLRFDAYMKEKVWAPAGMQSTRLEKAGEIVPRRARQYVKDGPGGRVRNAPYADLSIKWAGGGIISTVEDLARFHIALDQGKLLQPEALAEMYTPYTLPDGSQTGYGLGWLVEKDEKGRTWIAHGGGATGGSSYLLRYPDGKLAVAIICNVQSAGNLRQLAMDIAQAAMATDTQEN